MTIAFQAKDYTIPAGTSHIDFAMYKGPRTFVDINGTPEFQSNVAQLRDELDRCKHD